MRYRLVGLFEIVLPYKYTRAAPLSPPNACSCFVLINLIVVNQRMFTLCSCRLIAHRSPLSDFRCFWSQSHTGIAYSAPVSILGFVNTFVLFKRQQFDTSEKGFFIYISVDIDCCTNATLLAF